MMQGFYSSEAFKSSLDDTWTTPRAFFDELNDEFQFKLDAAALKSSALCDFWYGPDHENPELQDAFQRNWQDDAQGNIWLNPPYGRTIKLWMQKAKFEATRGGGQLCAQFLVEQTLLGGMKLAYNMKCDLSEED